MIITNFEHLEKLALAAKKALEYQEKKVLVCCGTGCVAAGALAVYEKLKQLVEDKGLLVTVELQEEKRGIGVKKSGCQGYCEIGPLVRIEPSNYQYIKVGLDDCEEIVEKTLIGEEPVERLLYNFNEWYIRLMKRFHFIRTKQGLFLKNAAKLIVTAYWSI